MFENVDGRTDGRTDGRRTTDGRTTDARVTGILIAHLGAFGSGELKTRKNFPVCRVHLAVWGYENVNPIIIQLCVFYFV